MHRRWYTAAALALWLCLIWTGVARAHVTLQQSSPAADAILDRNPMLVVLQFTDGVEARFGAIAVYNQQGERVDNGDAMADRQDRTRVFATMEPLPEGIYTVAWRVVSADGHPISGSYGFVVGEGTQGAAYYEPDLPPAGGMPPGSLTLGAWLMTAGLMAAAGLALTQRVVLRTAPDPVLKRALAGALAASLAGALLTLVARTAQAAGISWSDALSPALLGQMLTTQAGLALLARIAILATGLGLLGRMGHRWWWSAWIGALGLLTLSVSGHPATLASPVLGVTLDWLHLMAAGVWVGGLLQFAVLLPARKVTDAEPEEARSLGSMVRRFSPLAALSIAVLIGTGLYPALQQITSEKALTYTDYGQIFTIKMALMAPLLLMGAANLFLVGPALQQGDPVGRTLRWVTRGELLMVGAVLVGGVLLANVPPARVALPPDRLDTLMHTDGYAIRLQMDPVLPGYRTVDVTIEPHEGELTPDTRVSLDLRMPDHDMGKNLNEKPAVLEGGRYRFENVLVGMHGAWEFRVIIDRPGYEQETGLFTVAVPAP